MVLIEIVILLYYATGQLSLCERLQRMRNDSVAPVRAMYYKAEFPGVARAKKTIFQIGRIQKPINDLIKSAMKWYIANLVVQTKSYRLLSIIVQNY